MDPTPGTTPVSILQHAADVLDVVRALRPAEGLPQGTLLVPNARVAQAIRKAALPGIIEQLNGWRLMMPIDAAIATIGTSGRRLERPHDELLALELEALFASRTAFDAASTPSGDVRSNPDETVLDAVAESTLCTPIRAIRAKSVLCTPVCGGAGGMEYFVPDQLAAGAGYAQAFAATIQRLAASGWTALQLAERAAAIDEPHGPRLRDVARVWAAVPVSAEAPDSTAIFARAAEVIRSGDGWWPFPGPAVALLVWPAPVDLGFLAALPDVRAAVLCGRPFRTEYGEVLGRVADTFGDATLVERARQPLFAYNAGAARSAGRSDSDSADEAVAAGGCAEASATASVAAGTCASAAETTPPLTSASSSRVPSSAPSASTPEALRELDLLQAHMFEPPDARRPRRGAAPPDGSVHFEIHPGLEQELQAAVDWVAEQVLVHRTPLEDIAVLVPEIDPVAGMLVDRLRTLDWGIVEPPVYVANGLPLHRGALACGVHAVLAALEQHLFAEGLHALLPHLRPQGLDYPLSYAQGGELIYSCGIAGGMPGAERAGLQWSDVFERRAEQARARAFRSRGADGREEGREVRGRKREERLLERIESLMPAIVAMVQLHEQVCQDRPLPELVAELQAFIGEHLYQATSPAARPDRKLIDEHLDVIGAMPAAARLRGRRALRVVRQGVAELRRSCGEVGEGQVYVGTLGRAIGLRFDAVRIIGLSEGTVPPSPREDAVLPEATTFALVPGEGDARSATGASPRSATSEARRGPTAREAAAHSASDATNNTTDRGCGN